jgi:hypothetical protein
LHQQRAHAVATHSLRIELAGCQRHDPAAAGVLEQGQGVGCLQLHHNMTIPLQLLILLVAGGVCRMQPHLIIKIVFQFIQ